MKVLMVGTGEYTTGWVHGSQSTSDKGAGVVGITLFDLRRRGLVDKLIMAGTNGTKFPDIRRHLKRVIDDTYANLHSDFLSFPSDKTATDPQAYLDAMDLLDPGDIVTIFTPDDTHHRIGLEALKRKLHVLIAKPLVKTLAEHDELIAEAQRQNVLCAMEVHKRWDPIYSDARDRAKTLGMFSHFYAYMSQPKSQLETFRSWAGKSSDINYYLNAHHIDLLNWIVGTKATPIQVSASAATGVAHTLEIPTEDSITLNTQWQTADGHLASAIFTSSWIAPKSDVHSQQHFFYQGRHGEIRVDQAHRGYSISSDQNGFSSPNPLFMKYAPDSEGHFVGQQSYGYQSIETFVKAAHQVNAGDSIDQWDDRLASAKQTRRVTAILEAGRISLDSNGALISL